jgi:hypothetical protein
MGALYETDFYSWTQEQAAALKKVARAKLNMPAPLDWENLAEEIESLGRSQESELESRYFRLLAHLLKWRHQPEQRSGSWRGTIIEQRTRLARLLRQNASLKARRREFFAEAYADARELAAGETELPIETFPEQSPWTIEQAEDRDFWPE